MKQTVRPKDSTLTITIAPFSGNLRILAKAAAGELVHDGVCTVTDIDTLDCHHSGSCDILLIEDGYTAPTSKEPFAEQELTITHHLVLKDLGLDEDAEISEDNINLVKDGIVAESIIVDSYPPQFNCPCCSKT